MDHFHQLRRRAGYADPAQCAEFLGVTRQTVIKWDKTGAPVAIHKLMQLLCKDLDAIGPDWQGFYFNGGLLEGPGGERITPGDIRAFPYLQRALDSMMAQDRERRAHRQRVLAWIAEGRAILRDTFRRKRYRFRLPRTSTHNAYR